METTKLTWSDFKEGSAPVSAAQVAQLFDEFSRFETSGNVGKAVEMTQQYLSSEKGVELGEFTIRRIRKEAMEGNIVDEDTGSAVHIANGSNYDLDEVLSDLQNEDLTLKKIRERHGIGIIALDKIRDEYSVRPKQSQYNSNTIQTSPIHTSNRRGAAESSFLRDAAAAGLALALGLGAVSCSNEDANKRAADYRAGAEATANSVERIAEVGQEVGLAREEAVEAANLSESSANLAANHLSEIRKRKAEIDQSIQAVEESDTEQNERLDNYKDRISGNETRLDTVERDTVPGLQNRIDEARGIADDASERIGAVEGKIAGGASAVLRDNEYSLVRSNLNDELSRVAVYKEGKLLQRIDLRRMGVEGDRGVQIESTVFSEVDGDNDGEFDLQARYRGLHVDERAERELAELEGAILEWENNPENAREILRGIGDNPSYPLLSDTAEDIMDIFWHAEEEGSYENDNTINIDAGYAERTDVRIEKTAPIGEAAEGVQQRNRYILKSGNDELADILVETRVDENERESAYMRIVSEATGREFEGEVPAAYVEDIVSGWATASQRSREEVLEARAEAERERLRQVAEQNRKLRSEEYASDYDRGVVASAETIDDNNHREEFRASFGGEQSNLTLHGAYDRSETELDEGIQNEEKSWVYAGFDFRLGDVPNGASANGRPEFRIDAFSEGTNKQTELGEGEAEVSVDGTGRFETTQQRLYSKHDEESRFTSLGFNGDWTSGYNLKFSLFGGNQELDWDEQHDVLIRDLTGIIPDIHNVVNAEGKSTTESWGIELIGAIPAGEGQSLIPVFGYKSLDIEIDDGTSRTRMEGSQSKFGIFYDIAPEIDTRGWGLTAGGIWTPSTIDGNNYDGFDAQASFMFKGTDYFAMGLDAGLNHYENNNEEHDLHRWGLMIMAGGRGSSDENLEAMHRYRFNDTMFGISDQFSEDAERTFQNFDFYNSLLLGGDANIILDLAVQQAYDENGDKGTDLGARFAYLHEFQPFHKLFIDANYQHKAFGDADSWDVGAGYQWRKLFLRGGYGMVDGESIVPLTLGFNAEF